MQNASDEILYKNWYAFVCHRRTKHLKSLHGKSIESAGEDGAYTEVRFFTSMIVVTACYKKSC